MSKGYAVRGAKRTCRVPRGAFDARRNGDDWKSTIAPGIAGAWAQSQHRVKARREAVKTGRAIVRIATTAVKLIAEVASKPPDNE